VLVVEPVGKIQAKDVRPRRKQGFDIIGGRRCGAESGNYFCVA